MFTLERPVVRCIASADWDMVERVRLNVNGVVHEVEVDDPGMPLLYALRDELGLNNPRFGCGLGQCGACTVQLDGKPVRSCQMPVAAAASARITTLAGLGTPEKPHPLQTAWIEEQVNQCAYCIASHTAAARKAGMSEAMFAELMAVVGMANETNRLASGYQVPIDERFRV